MTAWKDPCVNLTKCVSMTKEKMVKRILVILLLLYLSALSVTAQCGEKCGVVRWPVKTLSDVTVTNVNFKPKRKTVKWLVNQTPPESKPKDQRINGLEWINFRVKGVLVGYKLSDDDNDYHVVIKDLKTADTMIVEFKDPVCSMVCSSRYLEDMSSARESFRTAPTIAAKGKVTGTFKRPDKRIVVEVIGVGFWDHKHGQIGVAKNGIELHPVIWFREIPNVERVQL